MQLAARTSATSQRCYFSFLFFFFGGCWVGAEPSLLHWKRLFLFLFFWRCPWPPLPAPSPAFMCSLLSLLLPSAEPYSQPAQLMCRWHVLRYCLLPLLITILLSEINGKQKATDVNPIAPLTKQTLTVICASQHVKSPSKAHYAEVFLQHQWTLWRWGKFLHSWRVHTQIQTKLFSPSCGCICHRHTFVVTVVQVVERVVQQLKGWRSKILPHPSLLMCPWTRHLTLDCFRWRLAVLCIATATYLCVSVFEEANERLL